MSWAVVPSNIQGGYTHVVPVDDLKNHRYDDCPCDPEIDTEDEVVVHHSFDGREEFEEGGRKPS